MIRSLPSRPDRRRLRPACDALEARTVLTSAAAAAYTSQIYLDALGRTATANEVTSNGALFDGPVADGNRFLDIVVNSAEYRNREISVAYDEALGRAPTAAERDAALAAFRRTGSSRDALVELYASGAYYTDAGATDAGYVSALYSDILLRGADAGGQAFWTDVLSRGVSRSTVARAILNSNESNRVTVVGLYQQYLRRDPEAAGLDFWAGRLAAGTSPEGVTRAFLAAPEYVQSTQTATGT
ncbi:MAG: DUF4214 domain-containing protein, partial [Thermoleophilia bacterium]|nr:DUF4214 domain-containing protein [Thermoleophilia bacterium]